MPTEAKEIRVSGIVQGVGFRPFVYQLAKSHDLKGRVANTSTGVFILLEGSKEKIDFFLKDLTEKIPPLAHITQIHIQSAVPKGYKEFSISQSKSGNQRFALISPDISICNDCLKELFDPDDRRYRYPFINCTNCGPRYTIIDDIPYDRPKTSMKHFDMCQACREEYDDPLNRRFHAQPNACPDCGPFVNICDREKKRIECKDPIDKAVSLLKAGFLLAIKGLGGFHLAVDAENQEAVKTLRHRKHREEKPLAVMSSHMAAIKKYAHVDKEEEALLLSQQRPIVLLKKNPQYSLAPDVSPRNRYVGVMLPYTPLHYLLLKGGFKALVMTSGNLSEEPIAIDNTDAFQRLRDIADYFLIHNRDIYLRSDDSVVKIIEQAPRFFRRSRGYVPIPVFLKHGVKPILACGAELKNTICLTKEDHAFLSQHIGDLENLPTYEFFQMTIEHLRRILAINPKIIAYDMHPNYLSTQFAMEQEDIEKVGTQHHHAHIVSCMAENRVQDPVIGLSLDGAGYGMDGKIWGGEVLVSYPHRFDRVAHLSYVSLPGGAAAIKEPWRMAASYLFNVYGRDLLNLNLSLLRDIEEKKLDVIIDMIEKGVNSPQTSSLGRLFDGVAAITGIRYRVAFEGQAAMELEMLADESTEDSYAYAWTDDDIMKIETAPIIAGVVTDIENGLSSSVISAKFHSTVIRMFAEICDLVRKETHIQIAALSGGCFQNTVLLSGLSRILESKGFEVLTHEKVPTNDGGISLGQAVIADAIYSQ